MIYVNREIFSMEYDLKNLKILMNRQNIRNGTPEHIYFRTKNGQFQVRIFTL